MSKVDDERIAAIAEEAAQVLQALLTCTRGGAKPSATLLESARRARTELLAVAEGLEANAIDADNEA